MHEDQGEGWAGQQVPLILSRVCFWQMTRARACVRAGRAQVTSSVGKQYGKDKMFDGCADTCWQSKEGKPQSITLEFDRAR